MEAQTEEIPRMEPTLIDQFREVHMEKEIKAPEACEMTNVSSR